MPPTSRIVLDVWKKLKEKGEAAVLELCKQTAVVGQRLEFKRKSSPDNPGISSDDKRGLGESLSGFSNAVGGVLIFRVADKKGENGLDCADKVELITDVRL